MYEKSIERDHFQKRTDTAVKIATTKFELMEEEKERERENLLGVISERLSCKYDDDDKQDVCVIAKWVKVSGAELPDYLSMVTPNLISFRLGKLKQEGVVGCILWRWQETKDSIADDTPRRNLRLPPNPS